MLRQTPGMHLVPLQCCQLRSFQSNQPMEFVLKEARISLSETQHLPKVNKTRSWREGGAAHSRAALTPRPPRLSPD